MVRAPFILIWDRLNTHVSKAMKRKIDARVWLTVFLLPAYAPDLNPTEGVWSRCKRSMANLAACNLDRPGCPGPQPAQAPAISCAVPKLAQRR
jgi:transposase